ncbi:N-acetylmuramoyl-L-alanine amidase isoform 2-T2 [Callospermophilus lateralis]
MDSVIQVLAELEQKAPVTEVSLTASARLLSAQDSGASNPLHHFLLETPSHKAAELDAHPLSPELQGLIKMVAQHEIRGGQEHGVVLAPDGSTVAVKPLLAGLEAGLQGQRVVNLPLDSPATPWDAEATPPGRRDASPEGTSADAGAASSDTEATLPNDKAKSPTTVDRLLAVTLAADLGLTFLQPPQTQSHPGLGTEGCWDQLSDPQIFTLLDPKASMLTMAFLNGALDGALLGDYLSQIPEPRPPLSHLLSQYYGAGVAGDPGFRSNFRRQNGAALTSASTLAQQFCGGLRRLRVRGPRLALGGRAHARPQLPWFRRGLRGQLHGDTAHRGRATHGARSAAELRITRWTPATRLQAARPPPARGH